METIPQIRVLCVDDHPVVRDGIALMLQGHDRLRLVATAECGREAITKFREFRPDVTLMDLRLPDYHGADVITELRKTDGRARIVALTTYAGDFQASRALKAGAMGYLLKGSLRTELIETIFAVHAGQRRISPEVAASISEHLMSEALTVREIEILRLLCGGLSNSEIAKRLRISIETVRGHLKCIYQKLGANDRTQAAVISLKRGILGD
jgi:DNA-binding NarL/FixJ family response regulator